MLYQSTTHWLSSAQADSHTSAHRFELLPDAAAACEFLPAAAAASESLPAAAAASESLPAAAAASESLPATAGMAEQCRMWQQQPSLMSLCDATRLAHVLCKLGERNVIAAAEKIPGLLSS